MEINGQTALVGIIANPIGHVRTPHLFNALVRENGINAICLPLNLMEEALHPFLENLPAVQNLTGLVVTIPFKERVVTACGRLTETAALVGAVNVMRFDREARAWFGGNFDGDGFVTGLKGQGHSLTGKRVLLLGAGGAGKSIAFAVAREVPRQLVIYNRTKARSQQLVQQLNTVLPFVEVCVGEGSPAGFEVIINATSLGINDDDNLPVDTGLLDIETLVCEAVVRNGDTKLLAAARARGCLLHDGKYMLMGQINEIARFLGLPVGSRSGKVVFP